MAAITTTGTLTAGNSRTFALAPGSALTLTLLPNCRVTVTETPETVSASDAGGNSPRTHNHQLAGVFTYGPYAMGGSVVVANASNSGSTVTWGRKDTGLNPGEIYSNYEGMTHTGTTAETILYSVLIPGGTIVAPASLEHYLRFQLTTTSDAGTRAVRTYLNTVNSLSGATLMGDMFHTTISVTYSYLRPGDPIIFPTSTSQLGWPRGNGPNSLNSLAADRTGTLDTAADMYFIVSATLVNAADSLSVRGVRLMLNGER